MKSTADMHPFYRLLFLKLDPVVMIWSAYRNILTAPSALDLYDAEDMYVNSHHDPSASQQIFALIAALATMAALLQHYSDDYNLWRVVQSVLLVWNLSFFNGTCSALFWWRREDAAGWLPLGVELVYCTEVLTLLILLRIAFLVGFWTRGRRVIRNGVLYDNWI